MEILILSCLGAFFAGLVDAIAGGGGLIQVPTLLFLFPSLPIPTIMGTNKFSMSSGTVISSIHYVNQLKINITTIIPALIAAFFGSLLGAKVLTVINDDILKPVIITLLIIIGVYSIFKKKFGAVSKKKLTENQMHYILPIIALLLGFYDGFFGPGTGSFLIFILVGLIGFSFLEGSAYSKLINLSANVAALLFFIVNKHVVYTIAIPMVAFNMLGNYMGAKLAIKKGSGFVRYVFLLVVFGILGELLFRHYFK